jgi:hypothetical protein
MLREFDVAGCVSAWASSVWKIPAHVTYHSVGEKLQRVEPVVHSMCLNGVAVVELEISKKTS